MGNKIFISYKYGDKYVRQNSTYNFGDWYLDEEDGNYFTARDYVTYLMEKVLTNHTNKAEKDDEDLSHLSEDTIQQKLYDRIYDSTVTIILLSKRMRDEMKDEKLQWIPREISYSLRDDIREDKPSYTNGILLVAVPDEKGMYDHAFLEQNCGVRHWQTDSFFKIIRDNMFNRKIKDCNFCSFCKGYHHHGDNHSFIHPVKWDDFIKDHNKYIDRVLNFRERLDEFEPLVKSI